ncbi:single-stranded DNA-binding protein [Nocardia sp. NPDC055029]
MPVEPTLPFVGNLASDIELTFTPSGVAVAHFTVASTPRVFDRNTGQWRDGDPLFLRCNIWREAAENAAESLSKGARILLMGRLKQRSYETRDGDKRTVYEVEIDEIGPSLRFATAKVTRIGRRSTGNADNGFSRPDTTSSATTQVDTAGSGDREPWAAKGFTSSHDTDSRASPALAGVGAAGSDSEPPF